jgi:hypothetical protein
MFPFNVAFWVLPALVPGEAEQLLREVDAKIIAAQSLRVEYTLTVGQDEPFGRGSIVLAERNRFRLEEWMGDSPFSTLVVSDGSRLGLWEGSHRVRMPSRMHPPDWHNDVLQSWLVRGGAYLSVGAVSALAEEFEKRPGPGEGPRTSHATRLPDIVVNGDAARVVEYDLSWRKAPVIPSWRGAAKARLAIDADRKVPISRSMLLQMERSKETLTVNYTRFDINPKLDEKLFEVPR